MTGFARVRRTIQQGEIVMSLKSVNHRGLDLHFHLPPELDALENDIRGAVKSGVARGHLQIHLSFARTIATDSSALNKSLLSRIAWQALVCRRAPISIWALYHVK